MWDDDLYLPDDALPQCEGYVFPPNRPPRRCRRLTNGCSYYCAVHRPHSRMHQLYASILRDDWQTRVSEWRIQNPNYAARVEQEAGGADEP